MKKAIAILSIVGFLALAGVALAQERAPECCKLKRDFTDINTDCTTGEWVGPAACGPNPGDPCYCPEPVTKITEDWGACCLFNTVYTAATWVMAILVTVSVLIGVYGGWQIATSGGDPAKVEKGRNWILYAIIGIIIGAIARGLPALVRMLIK